MEQIPLSAKQVVELSKKLSYVLRHNAVKMGLHIGTDGRVELAELLTHPTFRGFTADNVRAVVETNDKKRFELSEIDGKMMIRAAQGHTIATISDVELLTEILDAAEVPVCVHGTYKAFLPSIMEHGLNRMKRNHIHMAPGLPGDGDVISGMRKSCEAYIYVNVTAAMEAGVKFYISSNKVVLTAGVNDSGVLPPQFFQRVVER